MTLATSQVVADTHVLVWYLTDSARLSPAARQALDACVADDHPIVVNSISLIELVDAAEKAKNPVTVDQRGYIFEVLDRDDSPLVVVPTTPAIARAMAAIDRECLPDPADRTRRGEPNVRTRLADVVFRGDLVPLIAAWPEDYDIDAAADLVITEVFPLL